MVLAALAALSAATGCATTPVHEPATVSFKWSVSPDDPCGKLAGSLAIADLFDFQSPPDGPDFQEMITTELERRCPENTRPEAFDFAVYIPASACGELQDLLEIALFFDVTVLVDRDRADMVDGLIADLAAEVARRCPGD